MLDLQNTLRTYQILCNSGKHSFISRFLVKSLSRVRLFVTPWTVAYQAPPSMGFSRQERWSGLPFPAPGDLPDLGIKPGSLAINSMEQLPKFSKFRFPHL